MILHASDASSYTSFSFPASGPYSGNRGTAASTSDSSSSWGQFQMPLRSRARGVYYIISNRVPDPEQKRFLGKSKRLSVPRFHAWCDDLYTLFLVMIHAIFNLHLLQLWH